MGFVAIELNDAGLVLARDQTILVESPGFALLEHGRLLVGRDAERQSRLKPRLVNNVFWERLSNDSLSRKNANAATYADLALAHLADLWTRVRNDTDGVIFTVPGYYDLEQLGLLLGIAAEIGLPTRGMIDSALAATRAHETAELLVHLDVQLHRSVLTGIEPGDDVRRVFVHSVEDCGLGGFYDDWIRLIGKLFVQATRFDPLHRAETEQDLYDSMPQWLAALGSEDTLTIEMQARDSRVHTIQITQSQIADAVRDRYQRILAATAEICTGQRASLAMTHRASRLPGLVDKLEQHGISRLLTLKPGAAALGALGCASHIADSSSVNSVTISVPRHLNDGHPASTSSTVSDETPTHVVHRGLVYGIDRTPFRLGRRVPTGEAGIAIEASGTGVSDAHCSIHVRDSRAWVEDHSTHGTFVNARKVEGTSPIAVGDTLTLGEKGETLQLVCLAKEP